MVITRECVFSDCRKYRYTLWREFGDMLAPRSDEYVMFIGLNPSTADETRDDPTIRRCVGFAKQWGFGALCMTNLFACRATKPKDMMRAELPVGLDNHHWLLKCASEAGLVIAAWGKNGSFLNQDISVRQWLASIGVNLMCLRKNSDGSPEHPLYIPTNTKPIPI